MVFNGALLRDTVVAPDYSSYGRLRKRCRRPDNSRIDGVLLSSRSGRFRRQSARRQYQSSPDLRFRPPLDESGHRKNATSPRRAPAPETSNLGCFRRLVGGTKWRSIPSSSHTPLRPASIDSSSPFFPPPPLLLFHLSPLGDRT